MPQPKTDRVTDLFNRGLELQEEYEAILSLRAENRTTLRGLASQGILSEEEAAAVEEMYPRRARGETVEDAVDVEIGA